MDKQSFELTLGEEKTIRVNSIVEFVLKTNGGTELVGHITPNNPLRIKNGGDIGSFDINIRQAPGDLKEVE